MGSNDYQAFPQSRFQAMRLSLNLSQLLGRDLNPSRWNWKRSRFYCAMPTHPHSFKDFLCDRVRWYSDESSMNNPFVLDSNVTSEDCFIEINLFYLWRRLSAILGEKELPRSWVAKSSNSNLLLAQEQNEGKKNGRREAERRKNDLFKQSLLQKYFFSLLWNLIIDVLESK